MEQPTFDPGLTQQFAGPLSRVINKDGSFNVLRRGGSWRDVHPYLVLINMPWFAFFAVVFFAFVVVNTAFAISYFALGPDQLQGADATAEMSRFSKVFFFSAHTLTTVGYGNVAPSGLAANILSALEAMFGLIGFALATGLLFGRVSKPSARLGFSDRIVMAPYQDGMSMQFRVVNLRHNALMELDANVLLMTVEGGNGAMKRKYSPLKLERRQVFFLPLTWTIVHPIDSGSPLYGKTPEELEVLQAEILILIKGFDDTFSQTVHAQYSYRFDEMIWGAKFEPAFGVDSSGRLVLDVDRVGDLARLQTAGQ
jgi:inward rectifier potassium channel